MIDLNTILLDSKAIAAFNHVKIVAIKWPSFFSIPIGNQQRGKVNNFALTI